MTGRSARWRESSERRFDGFASLAVKRSFLHPTSNQSDKTFGTSIDLHGRMVRGHDPAKTTGVASMEIAFSVIVERDEEGFYVATVPELRGCHTQARSLDSLMERVREAIDLCLEEQGRPVSSSEFVGVQRITVQV
jgi:predicted RNase H-like HicB family nuclease